MPTRTIPLSGLYVAQLALVLLMVLVGNCVFAAESEEPLEAVPVAPGPPPPLQEKILSPIPKQFDWMRREVRPNPLLEALLALRERPPRLLVTVSLSEEYSDNFFLSERDREEEFRTSVSIGTAYRLESGRSFISLANLLSSNYDVMAEQGNIAFANLSLNAGYQLPRLSLTLSENFVHTDNAEEASPAGVRNERRRFLRNSISPQIRYDLTRTTAISGAYSNIFVKNEDMEGGDLAPSATGFGLGQGTTITHSVAAGLQHWITQTFSSNMQYAFSTTDSDEVGDTLSHTMSVNLGYALSARTSTSFQAFGEVIDRSAGDPDSRIYGVSVGLRRQLTSFLSAFVSIGPSLIDISNRSKRIFPNWQANLDWALPLPRRTSLGLSAQQSLDNTASDVDDVGVVLSRSATLTLIHAVSRDLASSLSIGYTRTELLESSGSRNTTQGQDFDLWNVGAGISYALTRILSLSASYRHLHRHASGGGAAVIQDRLGGDFDENRFILSLSAALPVF
jgi:opacity protein-like surface antigen